jgi:hypothetical protein
MRDGAITASSTECLPLDLLLMLLGGLRQHDIQYCYWKSSRRIHEVLSGKSDMDLLVARRQQHDAGKLLLTLGFKLFPAVANRADPAILSFLGYDEPSGQLIHVHLHICLVAGDSLLKNYRLPWEDAVLTRAVAHPTMPIRILDPASEALLMIIRACLELRRRDPVTLRNWRRTSVKFELDRKELAARVDRAELRSLAMELLDSDMADMICDALHAGRPLDTQRRLRRRVRSALAAYRMYNAIEGQLRSAVRALLWLAGGLNDRFLHIPRPWSRRVPGGGIVVALLGVDGSGKTTVLAAIRGWLAGEIDTLPMYFGTGDGRPSLLLLPLKLMVPVITCLFGTKPKGSSHGKVSDGAPGPIYSLLLMLWATVLAAEKQLKLRAAHRGARRGLLVIADRYPQNEILDYNDGPLLPRLSIVPRWLRRYEANAYALARRLPPDLVIKLEAPPETLAVREPNMDLCMIRQRVLDLQRLTFPGAHVVAVNATLPLTEVVRAAKSEIWRRL